MLVHLNILQKFQLILLKQRNSGISLRERCWLNSRNNSRSIRYCQRRETVINFYIKRAWNISLIHRLTPAGESVCSRGSNSKSDFTRGSFAKYAVARRVASSTCALRFLHLNFDNDDTRLGPWKRYPYRAQWYPPSRSLVHETVKHRQCKPIKGWVHKGCIRERAAVITRNCVKFKFLFPRPQGLASWSFEPWRLDKEDVP